MSIDRYSTLSKTNRNYQMGANHRMGYEYQCCLVEKINDQFILRKDCFQMNLFYFIQFILRWKWWYEMKRESFVNVFLEKINLDFSFFWARRDISEFRQLVSNCETTEKKNIKKMLMSKHLYFQDNYDVWRYSSGICKSQRSINETRLGGWEWNRRYRINKISSHPRPHSPICAYLDCQLVVMTMKWNFDVPKWKEQR